MNEITVSKTMSVKDMKTHVAVIQEMMKAVMKSGTHYGTIPGCGDKPTLLKAGAEKIAMTFRLSCDPDVEDLSSGDVLRYRVRAKLNTFDGTFVGSGIGEASTAEEKYRWRKAVCDEEYNATPENDRRIKWGIDYKTRKPYQLKQVKTNSGDLANTVLKMAKKRAFIDAILTSTAASDCFMQDVEDLPEEIREEILNGETVDIAPVGKPDVEMPKAKEPTATTEEHKNQSEAMKRVIGLMQKAFATKKEFEAWLVKRFESSDLDKLSEERLNMAASLMADIVAAKEGQQGA